MLSILQFRNPANIQDACGSTTPERQSGTALLNRREGYEILGTVQDLVDHFGPVDPEASCGESKMPATTICRPMAETARTVYG